MNPPVLRPAAAADVEEAWRWYEARREGLGDEFLEVVRAGLESIRAHPESAPVVRRDVRRHLLKRFPSSARGWRMETEAVMTKALKEAFEEAEELPEREQDQLAAAIRAEIAVERAWEAQLAASGGVIGALADEALAEHRSGRTLPLDPDEQ